MKTYRVYFDFIIHAKDIEEAEKEANDLADNYVDREIIEKINVTARETDYEN